MQDHDPYGAQAGYPQQNSYGMEQWEEPRRTSIAAILGLISSLIFCIPVITQVLGLFFGFIGILSVGMSGGRRKGTGLSVAAIILSTLILGGWILAGIGGYGFLKEFSRVPIAFVDDALRGNYAEARKMMAPKVRENVTEQDLADFRQRLETNYGSFQSVEMDWTWHAISAQAQAGQQQQYQNAFPWCVVINFDNENVYAIVEMEPQQNQQAQPQSIGDVFRIRKVTIMRPDGTFWDFPADPNAPSSTNGGGNGAPSDGDEGGETGDGGG